MPRILPLGEVSLIFSVFLDVPVHGLFKLHVTVAIQIEFKDEMMKAIRIILILIIFSSFMMGLEELVLTDKWEHADEIPGRIQYSTIDKDGCPVACFFKIGNRLITRDKIVSIAPWGQGPDEVMNTCSIFPYKDGDLAITEDPGRIKIFKKETDNYKFKKSIWLKRGGTFHALHNTVFFDGKFFTAGLEILNYTQAEAEISSIKVYDEEGNFLKNLMIEKLPTKTFETRNIVDMRRYILNYKDKIYYLIENELKVSIVSGKNLVDEKKVELKKPDFYKKMPDDFFTVGKQGQSSIERSLNIEHWLVSYSRITKTVVEKDWLIIQVRTCNPKLKRFSLLFYNAGNFNLEKTFFIDDLLLGAKDGKLYCYGDGDPGLDDEVVKTVIKIYSIK